MKLRPHDITLYDTLHVLPNATLLTIQKSYRILSRQYHPDKRNKRNRSNNNNDTNIDIDNNNDHNIELNRIRDAYEILKNNDKRLLYHLYGFIDSNSAQDAFYLLTGQIHKLLLVNNHYNRNDLNELLHFMGYHHDNVQQQQQQQEFNNNNKNNIQQQQQLQYQYRIHFIARNIIELIRPVIEDNIPIEYLIDYISELCDRMKSLPLGAHIIRCIGRSYRHMGRKVLKHTITSSIDHYYSNQNLWGINNNRKESSRMNMKPSYTYHKLSQHFNSKDSMRRNHYRKNNSASFSALPNKAFDVSHRILTKISNVIVLPTVRDVLEDQYRNMKLYSTAAYTTGKATIVEKQILWYNNNNKKNNNDNNDNYLLHNNDIEEELLSTTTTENNNKKYIQSQYAILQSLQVDALWKLYKIDLDHIIQNACELILYNTSSLFLNDDGYYHDEYNNQHDDNDNTERRQKIDGWISRSNGKAITIDETCRIKIASLLVMIGDIMIQRSKMNTGWNK